MKGERKKVGVVGKADASVHMESKFTAESLSEQHDLVAIRYTKDVCQHFTFRHPSIE